MLRIPMLAILAWFVLVSASVAAAPSSNRSRARLLIDGDSPDSTLSNQIVTDPSFAPCAAAASGDENWSRNWEPNDPLPSVNDLEVHAGVLYAAGRFDYAATPFIRNIARWDGTKWRDLDHGVVGTVYDMAWYGDELFVTGTFFVACSPQIKDMARWKEGSGWTSAGGVSMRAIASDGYRLFGLPRTDQPNTELVQWDGTQWNHVATFTGYTRSLAIGANGKVYVAGNITSVDGLGLSGVAAWDGVEWDNLGGGISGTCTQYGPYFSGVATDADRVYVWGEFKTGIGATGVTYWEAGTWHKTNIPGPCGDSGAGNFDIISTIFPDGNAVYYSRQYYDPYSCVDGGGRSAATQVATGTSRPALAGVLANDFVKYNNKVAIAFGADGPIWGDDPNLYQNALIATWNGTTLSPLGDGLHFGTKGLMQPLRDIAIAPNEKVYIAGLGDGNAGVHSWTGSVWKDFPVSGNIISVVFEAVASYKGWTIAGGRVNYLDDNPDDFVLRFNANGTSSQLPEAPDNFVHCMVTGGGLLYLGGDFTHAGTLAVNHVAGWNGSQWKQLGPGLNGPVYALTYADGLLYAGGDFTFSSRAHARNLAVWDGRTWSPLNKGTDGPIYTILPTPDGLVVGGNFEHAGVTKAPNIAMLDENGWRSFADGFDDDVRGVAMSDGGWLYATGRFTHSGSMNINRVARWDGVSWSSMGKGLDNTGRDIVAVGKHIYVGGYFTTAGSTPSQYFAEWAEREPVNSRRSHNQPNLITDARPPAVSLEQNNPNPFNPTTQIPFTLATSSHLHLAIYDAQGKLVRTVLDEERPAGAYSATWNGRDDRGSSVASGVYFCVMRAGNFEATRKMVLLK